VGAEGLWKSPSSWVPKDSSSIAAKSSRDGITWVAIEFSNPSLFPAKRLDPLVLAFVAATTERRRGIRTARGAEDVDAECENGA
jgi:hypothetical protein